MERSDKISKDLAKRIRELEALKDQITQLQAEAEKKAIYIEAQQDMLKLMNKPFAPVTLRAGSDPEKVRNLLLTVETPLHVDMILQKLGKTASAKPSLVGSLNAYSNDGKIFTKPAPNTFGLLEKDYANAG